MIIINSDSTSIRGNLIGTAPDGTSDIGALLSGVEVRAGADFTDIGGTEEGAGNTIAFNGTGVRLEDGSPRP